MGGNGGRPHLSAVTTWPKLISFPFPGMGLTLSAKGQKLGLFLSAVYLLLPSQDGGGECLWAPLACRTQSHTMPV